MGEFDVPLEDIFANGQVEQEASATTVPRFGRSGLY